MIISEPMGILKTFSRVIFVSIIAGLGGFEVIKFTNSFLSSFSVIQIIIQIIIGALVFGIIYLGGLYFMKAPEINYLKNIFRIKKGEDIGE
jgi:hypothetical protein